MPLTELPATGPSHVLLLGYPLSPGLVGSGVRALLKRAQPKFKSSFLPGPGAALGHPRRPHPWALGEIGMPKMGELELERTNVP